MIVSEEFVYNDNDLRCLGFIAYEAGLSKKKPCVLIAHDWEGRSPAMCNKAKQIAAMGYVAFALDMYGHAQLGKDNTERRALMTPLIENRSQLAERIIAAYNAASSLPQVDKDKIAAIGYCFGGLCVLDLARSGVNVKGVVSFHGLLTKPEGAVEHAPFNAKVLVLHGYDDPLVKPDQIGLFAQEMNARKVDWQVHMYGLTQHAFTNPMANDDEMGLHYNEKADRRSWQSTELFLNEVFA